jgi:TPR repeat protein
MSNFLTEKINNIKKKLSENYYKYAMIYYNKRNDKNYKTAFGYFMNSKDNDKSMNAIGKCYYKGYGVMKDYDEAYKWFLLSINLGNIDAIVNMGICYENGHGVMKDSIKALEYYYDAAYHDNNRAHFCIGKYFENNDNKHKAFIWYQSSANLGNIKGMFNTGVCYEYGYNNCINIDMDKAIEYYMKSGELEFSEAYYSLGTIYISDKYKNIYKEYNYQKSLYWFEKGCDINNPKSLYNVGVFYYNGYYVKKNKYKALIYFIKSAELNDPDALYMLGCIYEEGDFVPINYNKSFEYYKKSADFDNIYALYKIGLHYEYKNEISKAIGYYIKSAELNNPNAMNYLGNIYEYGRLVNIDLNIAFNWYQQSANKGDIIGIQNLSYCYYYGKGVEKNEKYALELIKNT